MNLNFFHFDAYTVNLNHVVSIAWDDAAKCASLTMAVGDDYDIDGEHYKTFKQLMGRK